MMAPAFAAALYSSSDVSLELNIILVPLIPEASASMSSGMEAQSAPQPNCLNSLKMAGVGVAFTAKYSLNPLFQAKALYRSEAHFFIASSSYT